MRTVNSSARWAVLLACACSRSPRAAPVAQHEKTSTDDARIAAQPPTDPCRPTSVPRGARAWLMFVGEFVRTEEDPESGYAEALRRFYFKPLKSWHGLASADETGGAMFVPNPGERSSLKAPPHFTRGQQVFVVVDRDGMSGQMNVVAEALPVDAARARIEALGAPCWTR